MRTFPGTDSGDTASLEGSILDFMLERYNRMGADDSGLYGYYVDRLQNQRVGLVGYERGILELFRKDGVAWPDMRIIHAGIGIGALTFALASAGLRVTGVDGDRRRFAAAEALRDQLVTQYPEVEKASDLAKGLFPQAVEDRISPDTFLLFTNVGAGWSQEVEDGIIAVMPRCGAVLFDLRLFGRKREEAGDQQELRGRIETKLGVPLERVTLGTTDTYVYGRLKETG